MKRLLTLAVITFICAIFLLWQQRAVTKLKEGIASHKAAPTSPVDQNIPRRHGSASQRRQATESSALSLDFSSSENAALISELLEFIPEQTGARDVAGTVSLLPQILPLLENHTPDELLELAAKFGSLAKEDKKAKTLRNLILLLVTGTEPERVMHIIDTSGLSFGIFEKVRSAALATMARRHPFKAQDYLAQTNFKERLKHSAEAALTLSWMQKDFPQALNYLRNHTSSKNWMIRSALDLAAHDPQILAKMKEIIPEEKNSMVQQTFSSVVATATLADSGLTGVEDFMNQIPFSTPAAREELAKEIANAHLPHSPVESIEWLMGQTSPENRPNVLDSCILTWTEHDYIAAGNWLKNQPPSVERDVAISRYSTEIHRIDPAAAMDWTGKIIHKRKKQKTREFVINQWHRNDPQAAQSWVTNQGWELQTWFPDAQ